MYSGSRAVALSTEPVHVWPQPEWTKVSNINVQVSVVQRPDFTIDISDAHILTQRQTQGLLPTSAGRWKSTEPGLIPKPSPSPLPSSPGASVRLEARSCHPSCRVSCQALPLLGVEACGVQPISLECLAH